MPHNVMISKLKNIKSISIRFALITKLECTEDNEETYETYSEAFKK